MLNNARKKVLIGSAVLLTIVTGGVAASLLRHHVIPKRFSAVVPGEVFRSGQISRFLIADVIDAHQIAAIIDLNGPQPSNANQSFERDWARSHGIQHCCFPLPGDGIGDPRVYARAIQSIVEAQRAKQPVLVHCLAGCKRTGACMAFYQLLVLRDPPDRVYRDLERFSLNHRVEPELLTFINANAAAVADELLRLGAIDGVPNPVPPVEPQSVSRDASGSFH